MIATFYTFDPVRIPAGSIGDEALFFPCVECGRDELLSGWLSTGPRFADVCVINRPDKGAALALYCPTCAAAKLAEHAARDAWNAAHPLLSANLSTGSYT